MNADQIWGIVRTILSAAGGYFVAKGVVSADVVASVVPAIGTIFVAVWSVLAKKPAA